METSFPIPLKPSYENRFGFPYRSTLSFVPLIKSLEEELASEEKYRPVIKKIVEDVKTIPELNQPIEDLEILKKYRDQIEVLMRTVVPYTLSNDILTGVIVPFLPVTVFGTKKFNELIATDDNGIWDISRVNVEDAFKELIAYAGISILQKYYGVKLERPDVMRSRLIDNVSGSPYFFKPDVHSNFNEIKLLKQPKPLSEIDLSPLNNNFLDTEFWLKNFPPDTFAFNGIVIYRMIDVTDREMIARIEFSMLENDSIISKTGVNDLQDKLQDYFQIDDLKLGLVPLYYYKGKMRECNNESWFCVLPLEKMDLMMQNFENSIYYKAIESRQPYIVEDLTGIEASVVENELLQLGIRSMIISPIFKENELIGIMEIASKKKDAFNFINMMKLKAILPIISVVMQRSARDYESKIQSTIKENYTSIHPAVEWKFINSAVEILKNSQKDIIRKTASIELDNVVAIYGQIDIRSSSDRRNDAVRLDIIDYVLSSITLLKEAYDKFSLNVIDELIFRGEKYLEKLKNNLDSGDESGILDFLNTEVKPMMQIIAKRDESLKIPLNNFIASLDPEHEHYHMRRKNFEQSLNLINDAVGSFLEEEEVRTQKMLPHYFEKYKTDGVEYNIYLGKSILEDGNFDPAFIRNFRLWQLISMVKIARETKALLPLLSVPLETTQLILCYSNPLSVIFRMDEKRFDVAGAYNIRYEIVKKRIDKAHINGTTERLTQPGSIAIIYSQEKEAKEYERYFEYLRAKDFITGEVERLEVEPLQGMQGLKAFRIQINYEPGEPKLDWREEELLKEVKGIVI